MIYEYGLPTYLLQMCEMDKREMPRRAYRIDANAHKKARKERARELTRKRMAEIADQRQTKV